MGGGRGGVGAGEEGERWSGGCISVNFAPAGPNSRLAPSIWLLGPPARMGESEWARSGCLLSVATVATLPAHRPELNKTRGSSLVSFVS